MTKRDDAKRTAWSLVEIDGLSHAQATRVLWESGFYEGARDYPTPGWLKGLLRDYRKDKAAKTAALLRDKVTRGLPPKEGSEPRAPKGHTVSHESGAESSEGRTSLALDDNGRSTFAASEYVFTDLETENPRVPVFTGEPHVEGDCIVTGDYQIPTTDWSLAEMVLQVGKATGIRTLLIIGDWVNMDAFSKYDHIVPPIDFVTETQVSIRLMNRYAGHFDHIWLALGNHEHRLLRAMKGNLSGSMLGRLISAVGGKLHITPYSHIIIHSGGQTWRATHQVNYSKLKGRVGDDLAQKFQSHVIVHHQHHTGKIIDRFGRYVIIDNGGIHDCNKMAYVKLRDSTSAAMTKGFTVVIDGTGHLITPYPAFTDLNLWLKQLGTRR